MAIHILPQLKHFLPYPEKRQRFAMASRNTENDPSTENYFFKCNVYTMPSNKKYLPFYITHLFNRS